MDRFIKNLAKDAGKILKDGFGKKLKLTSKSASWDLVTQFDLASDKYIVEKIRRKYPNHGIYSEESGQTARKSDFWIIDPLDGTAGFVNNVPSFGVSIAFVSDNKLRFGAVYQPMTAELFFAKQGDGASLNNKKISVGNQSELKFSKIFSYMHLNTTTKNEKIRMYKNIVNLELRFLPAQSVAIGLSFVACGRHDIAVSKGLYPWDYSAGAFIMKEAGAKVTDFQGKPYRWDSDSVIGANPVLHQKIMENFKFK